MPTETPTKTPGLSRAEKYADFRNSYIHILREDNLTILGAEIDAEAETLHLTFELRDPTSGTAIGGDVKNVTHSYAAGVHVYRDDKFPEVNETWIPKRVNVTAMTPDGLVYSNGHIEYEWAAKIEDGGGSPLEEVLRYYGTVEYGPGHDKYKE